MRTRSGRIAVFALTTAALLVPAPACLSTQWVGEGPRPKPILPDDARAVMIEFQSALRSENWDRALALCSQKVKEATEGLKSTKALFELYVPMEDLLKVDEFRISGKRTRGEKHEREVVEYRCFVKTNLAPWVWRLQRAGDTWLVDFEPSSYRIRLTEKKGTYERWMREFEENRAAMRPKMKGLEALLTTEEREYLPGEPVLLRLELTQTGKDTLWYDDQQVTVNDPLSVENEDGGDVPYIADTVQTGGYPRPITAGQTVVLFKDLDLSKLYAINRPGVYTVQWRGMGLSMMEAEDPDPMRRLRMKDEISSNPVEIVVKEGRN